VTAKIRQFCPEGLPYLFCKGQFLKRFIKFILKLFIPIHIRRKIRFLLNLDSYFEKQTNEIQAINNAVQNRLNDIYNKLNDIQWETKKIQSIIYTKENAPLVFEKITAPLINDPLFADTVVKDLNLPEFICMRDDSWNNARMLVKRFGMNVNGLPINTVRDYLFCLVKIKPVCEYAFHYLVRRLAPQYKDDLSEKILDEAYSYLSFNDSTAKWIMAESIMRYICILMLRKDIEKAEKIFIKSRSLFEKDQIAAWLKDQIAAWLPVAYIAQKNGMDGDDIRMSVEIFKKFSDQEAMKNEFDKYIQDKSIAIVGNGPAEENTGHGMEIDNHDIVVRFNDFVIDESSKRDYGEKVNICCLAGGWEIKPAHYSADYIISSCSMYYHFMSKSFRKFIFENPEKRVLALDMEVFTFFQDNYNYYGPSNGLLVRLFFKNNQDKYKKLGFYGFSVNKVIYGHYYDGFRAENLSMDYAAHNLYIESEIHKDLFKDLEKSD
jgi:hypothetical protein